MEELLSSLFDDLDLLHAILLTLGIIYSCAAALSGTLKKAKGNTVDLISQAELKYGRWEKSGELKEKWVIEQLRGLVPVLLRPFYKEEQLKTLVGNVFSNMSDFSRMQTEASKSRGDDFFDACAEGGHSPVSDSSEVFAASTAPPSEGQMIGGVGGTGFRVEYLGPDEFKVTVCPKRAELRDI